MRKNKKLFIYIAIIAVLIVGIALIVNKNNGSKVETPAEVFAQCVKDSGAKFFGAFWCPHCQNQKMMFGLKASKKLPYFECSNPDKSQNKLCTDEKIEAYPTWKFADGTVKTGEVSIKELSEKTGCAIPQN